MYEIIKVDGPVMFVRVSGTARLAEHEALQSVARKMIERGVKPRVLVRVENFQGWEKNVDWGDMQFMMEFGDDIEKMAFVGDEKWKDQIFLFTAKGLRKTKIEYFAPSALAQAEKWVRE